MSFPTISWDSLQKVSASQMEQIFVLATGKYALDTRVLLEHAARNLSDLASALAPDGPVLVVAGRGHNGGGGLAAARLLAARGRPVFVVPTHEAENYSGVPREQLEHLKHYDNVRMRSSLPKMKFACAIDAAIGTSLEGPPRGRTLDVITVLNNMNGCVIAFDAPTGMNVDDGDIPGAVVNATVTLSLGLPKTGIQPGASVGELFVGDLALPPALYRDAGLEPVKLPGWITKVSP
ncbi:MAG TPA: NAD(P)H-hydrate epimerase [Trueperaceae bacterium]